MTRGQLCSIGCDQRPLESLGHLEYLEHVGHSEYLEHLGHLETFVGREESRASLMEPRFGQPQACATDETLEDKVAGS